MPNEVASKRLTLSRRRVAQIMGAAALAAPAMARAQPRPRTPVRRLIKGGVLLTGDARLGDFASGDILIEGERIAAVSPAITADAEVIDASSMIVIPGLVDAHKHYWLGAFRHAIPNGSGADYGLLANTVLAALRPEDAYLAALAGDLAAINAGVTTVLDYAHLSKSPEVVDGAIAGHQASGLRSVFAYSETRDDATVQYDATAAPRTRTVPPFPSDLPRLIKTYFSSKDQLLTVRLADARGTTFDYARRMGVGITCDGVFGVTTPLRKHDWSPTLRDLAVKGKLGPDVTLIHCTGASPEIFALLAEHGVSITLAPTSDGSLRGLGDSITPIQQVLDHGLVERCGISTDIDVELSNDLLAQMRAVFLIQRVLASARWQSGDANAPSPMTVDQVLTMATRGGARAVGLADRIGTLAPGKQADITLIRYGDLGLGPLNNARGSVVIGASPANVDTVLIRGEIRKRDGKLVGVDQVAVMRRLVASRDFLASAAAVWRPADVVSKSR